MKSLFSNSKSLVLFACCLFVFNAEAQKVIFSDRDLALQEKYSFFNLLKNISVSDQAVGSVSQYRAVQPLSQNVHSVRDAALATEALMAMYVRYPVGNEKATIKKMLIEQVQFQQKTVSSAMSTQLGLGTAYFSLDGSNTTLMQPRVQSEALALRAISMIKLYNLARVEQWREFQALRKVLFDNTIGSRGLLKLDLDFIVQTWMAPSFDLWSQVNGRHFANLILLKKALIGGSAVASSNGDLSSSRTYAAEAGKIQNELEKFWDASKKSLVSTKGSLSGSLNKSFLWDSSVLFGLIEGQVADGTWNMGDDRVISSLDQMQEMFRRLYPVNQNNQLAPAMGRYPEDSMGQPLVQVTSLMAQYYYDLNAEISAQGKITITDLNLPFFNRISAGSNYLLKPGVVIVRKLPLFQFIQQALLNEGDRFLARLLTYKNSDATLSEQFSRLTSLMQGPQNSTAATTAFLSAKSSRDSLLGSNKKLQAFKAVRR